MRRQRKIELRRVAPIGNRVFRGLAVRRRADLLVLNETDVAQKGIQPGVEFPGMREDLPRLADCQSATQRSATPRYRNALRHFLILNF